MSTDSLMLKNGLTGWHVLFVLLAMFVTVTSVNLFMAYKAISTFGGLDTQDAYRKGLNYNQRIEDARAQAALGWTDEAKLDAAAGTFTVSIKDSTQKGVDGLDLAAVIGRPATNAEDREVAFRAVGAGIYAAEVPGLADGAWVATVAARKAGSGDDKIVYKSKVRLWKAP